MILISIAANMLARGATTDCIGVQGQRAGQLPPEAAPDSAALF